MSILLAAALSFLLADVPAPRVEAQQTGAARNTAFAAGPARGPAQEQNYTVVGDEIHIAPGQENLPAEQVFKNIEILKSKPASRLPGMMKALNGLLGVPCTHCHVKDAWEKEEPQAKVTSRRMFAMLGGVTAKYFAGGDQLSCWTCHRGQPKPPTGAEEIRAALEKLPEARQKLIADLLAKLGDKKDQPAEQAFENIQSFKGMPAARLLRTMSVFTIVLGVNCTHCHAAGEWSKDDKTPKQTARKMLRMVGDINRDIAGIGTAACWTCHRGAAKPAALV